MDELTFSQQFWGVILVAFVISITVGMVLGIFIDSILLGIVSYVLTFWLLAGLTIIAFIRKIEVEQQ